MPLKRSSGTQCRSALWPILDLVQRHCLLDQSCRDAEFWNSGHGRHLSLTAQINVGMNGAEAQDWVDELGQR